MVGRPSLLAGLALAAGACGRIGFDPGERLDGDGATGDAPRGDGRVVSPCSAVEPDTVALYVFEVEQLPDVLDATGAHHGMVNLLASIAESGDCGRAFQPDNENWIEIPDSPAFDLPTGSLELRARIGSTTFATYQFLATRDALSLGDGHFVVGFTPDGRVFTRIQHTVAGPVYRCTEPVASGAWHHIGVSFGGTPGQGLRLWVDGVLAAAPSFTVDSLVYDCSEPSTNGLVGNDSAFIFAASNWQAEDGEPISHYAYDVQLDEIHLRSSWRDFGAP